MCTTPNLTTTDKTTIDTTTIDMVTPQVAGATLQLDNDALLEVVNRGLLPAYDLGGVIRFRSADVAAVAREFAFA